MNIPPAVSSLLRSAAPTLLTALAIPPPFGLIASAIASGVIGHLLPADEVPKGAPVDGQPALAPEQVVKVIHDRAGDPAIMEQLREVEERLKDYEYEHNIRFAEIAAADRKDARAYSRDTGIALQLLKWGMSIVAIAIASLMALVIGLLLLMSGAIRIPPEQAQMAMGIFGLIGTIVGALNGFAAMPLSFYFGSSQGSQSKDASLEFVMTEQGRAIGEATQRSAETARVATQAAAQVAAAPKLPAPTQTPPEAWMQGPFGGIRWRITADGLIHEGEAEPKRTVGEPITVRRIWSNFGQIIADVCAAHSVPPEVVVAMIATESRGAPAAFLKEPDGRTSLGLMQILTGTASDVVGRDVSAAELADPEFNISVGVRYMERFRDKTHYDPILSAACHNAGGLYQARAQDRNPYNLRTTGDHLARMALYYNDAVFAAKADRWFSPS